MLGDPGDGSTPNDMDAVYDPVVQDVDDVLDAELVLGDDAEEELEGWSPPDSPLAVEDFGTTVEEQMAGETLGDRELRLQGEAWLADSGVGRPLAADGDGVRGGADGSLVGEEGEDDVDLSAEDAAIHRIDPGPDVDLPTFPDDDSPRG